MSICLQWEVFVRSEKELSKVLPVRVAVVIMKESDSRAY